MGDKPDKPKPKSRPKWINFLFGGSAGMAAAAIVQPFDLLKNRMQMSGQGKAKKEFNTTGDVIKAILKNEGIAGFYNGLSAGLVRQATYTTTRLGVYSALFERAAKDGPPSFATKASLGMIAGIVGSFVGTPADVALIRMTTDGRLPPNERRNYKNVIHAWYRICVDEGVTTLWKGAIPTMIRAMVVNAAQLGTYSQAKQMLLTTGFFKDNIGCHAAASLTSGFLTTIASMPVDICKTRLQNMKKAEYNGMIDVFFKVLSKEGPFAFWKGFTAYFLRLGPHTIFVFIFLEQLNHFYDKHVLGGTSRTI